MSNILNVFNPPQPRDLRDDEVDCLGCTAVQSLLAFGGGVYLASSLPFKDSFGKVDLTKNPIWWQKSIKSVGVLVFGLGAYRAGEVFQILYDRYEKKKSET